MQGLVFQPRNRGGLVRMRYCIGGEAVPLGSGRMQQLSTRAGAASRRSIWATERRDAALLLGRKRVDGGRRMIAAVDGSRGSSTLDGE
eukprot:7248829-Prymnesium_polylepis.2